MDGAFRPHRGFGAMQRAVDAMLSVGTDDGRPSLLQAMAHPLWPNGPDIWRACGVYGVAGV